MSEFRQKNFGERKLPDAAPYLEEMREHVAFAGGKLDVWEDVPRWLERAALHLNIPVHRARGYWYRKIKVIPIWEADHIRAHAAALRERQADIHAANQATREAIARGRALLAGRAADQGIGPAVGGGVPPDGHGHEVD